jgi:hypothetical protein
MPTIVRAAQTAEDLQDVLDTLLAPLLAALFNDVRFTAVETDRLNGTELVVTLSYSAVVAPITTPFKVKVLEAKTSVALQAEITAFAAANPTYFISPAIATRYVSTRRTETYVAVLFYNTNAAEGAANWGLPSAPPVNGLTFNEPAADNSAGTQSIFDSATVGESVAFPDLLYLKSDGKWWKADADFASMMPGLRMALESKSADQTCSMLVAGRVRDDDWNWTVGGMVYASTTAGALTQTIPSGAADVVQIVGAAYHADKIIFSPSPVTVEIV